MLPLSLHIRRPSYTNRVATRVGSSTVALEECQELVRHVATRVVLAPAAPANIHTLVLHITTRVVLLNLAGRNARRRIPGGFRKKPKVILLVATRVVVSQVASDKSQMSFGGSRRAS